MKRLTLLSLHLLAATIFSCTNKTTMEENLTATSAPTGAYFGFQGDTVPELMLPGFISTPNPELNGTFSPDGTEFFYSITFPQLGSHMVFTRLQADNSWSTPELASFSGNYGGVDPLFAPDGNSLYFTSWRPRENGEEAAPNGDIWVVERSGEGWKAPQNLGLPLNSDDTELYSSVSNAGNIYYGIRNEGLNIFKATKNADGYTVQKLGDQINSPYRDGDPFISPDEDYMIFCSNRPGGYGNMDLYISFQEKGEWSDPINLGPSINSPQSDYAPTVSADQKIFVFTSGRMKKPWDNISKDSLQHINSKINSADNGLDNIYWMNANFIEKLRAADQKAPAL
jgi:Tol biopolymer transport system component